MPLRALYDKHDFFAPFLTEKDRSKDFFCPVCDDKFRVVIPKKDICKHFRHTDGHVHGEPESEFHVEMKNFVAKIASESGYETKIEFIIDREKEYIADVLVCDKNNKFAIECQCSPLDFDYFVDKTNFYLIAGFVPVWIFGANWYRNTTITKIKKRVGRAPYYIQRISKIEKLLDKSDYILWYYADSFGKKRFLSGSFSYRWNSKYLGWFKLEKVPFSCVLLSSLSASVDEVNGIEQPCFLHEYLLDYDDEDI